jgi:hypothetical protein
MGWILSHYTTIVRCDSSGLILHNSFMSAIVDIPAYLSKDIIRFFKHGGTELDFNNRFFKELYDEGFFVPSPRKTWTRSDGAQSIWISEIVQKHFKDIDHANFLVVGDMNATSDDNSLKLLLSQTWIENVVKRLPEDEQWTYYYDRKKQINQHDYLLLSKVLAKKNPDTLSVIERRDIADYVKAYIQAKGSPV